MHIITLFSSRLFSLRSDPLLLLSSAQSRQCFFLNRSTQWRKMWESFSSRCTAAETSARSSWWSATLSRVRTSLSSTSSNTFALGALAMHAASPVRQMVCERLFHFIFIWPYGTTFYVLRRIERARESSISKGPINIRRKTNKYLFNWNHSIIRYYFLWLYWVYTLPQQQSHCLSGTFSSKTPANLAPFDP